MDIEELLKTTNARVEVDDRWLVWYLDEWCVSRRIYYARENTTLYRGDNFEEALGILKERTE